MVAIEICKAIKGLQSLRCLNKIDLGYFGGRV